MWIGGIEKQVGEIIGSYIKKLKILIIMKQTEMIKSWFTIFINNKDVRVKILLPLSLVMIAVFFKNPIEELVNFSIVNPILSKIEGRIIRDVILILLFLFSSYSIGKRLRDVFKKKGKIDIFSIYYIILLLSVYSYCRFSNDSPYEYVPFTFLTKIKYFDVVIFCLLAALIRIEPFKTRLGESKSMFFEDHAATFNASDLFHRDNLINGIVENSINLETKKSFAIAIQGEWGSGKSYVLSQIKNQIEASGKDNIIIEFDPWKYANTEKILNAFFDELTKEIKVFNEKLSNQISKYSDAIISIHENTFTKSLKSVAGIFYPALSINELFREIADTIPNTGKRIHVFLDDLDRLDSDEVLEILKLIRNTANFPNTIFYVAFDKGYISDVIKKSNKVKNEEYLEKIFQLQISLPKINADVLFFQLKELLRDNRAESEYKVIIEAIEQINELTIENQNIETDGIFPPGKNILKSKFKNLRDVIRFVNMVNLELPLVYSGVDIQDFILLLVIKFKHPDVFLLLKDHNCFIPTNTEGAEVYSINYDYLLKQLKIINGTNDTLIDIDAELKLILQYMYNSDRVVFSTKSIRFARNQMLYFAYDSFGKISHNQFLEIKNLGNIDQRVLLKTTISDLEEDDFLSVLLNYNPTFNREDFEKVIELYRIYYNHVSYKYKGIIQGKLEQYLTKEDTLVMRLYENEAKFVEYVKSFFYNAVSPYYIEALIAHNLLKPVLYGKTQSALFDQDSLKTYLLDFLKLHIDKEPLSDATFDLFYLIWDKIDPSTSIFSLTKDALNMMNRKITSNLENKLFYAKYLIRPWGGLSFDKTEKYVLEPLIKDIFSEPNEFENLLSSLPEDIQILEIKAFYRRCKQNNYKPMPFNRGFIEIESDCKTIFMKSQKYPQLSKKNAVEFINPKESIKISAEEKEPLYSTYKWIAHVKPEELTDEEATKGGDYIFLRTFEIPTDYSIENAELFVAYDDTCEVFLNKNMVITHFGDLAKETFFQKATIPIEYFQSGKNSLKMIVTNYNSVQIGHGGKPLTYKENIYGIAYSLRIQLKQKINLNKVI